MEVLGCFNVSRVVLPMCFFCPQASFLMARRIGAEISFSQFESRIPAVPFYCITFSKISKMILVMRNRVTILK